MRGVAFVGMMKKKIMRECVPVQSSDVLRQSKTSIIVFITFEFFKKVAGYDTLRLILCKKSILVEGDSDELVVQRA